MKGSHALDQLCNYDDASGLGQQAKKEEEGADISVVEDVADADMEYARQLQASFDRENEVIASIERKRSSIATTDHNSRNAKRKSNGESIACFFVKKEAKRT